MILQSLHALYHRLKDDPTYRIAPPGFSPQKIAFKVVIKPDGELFEIQDNRVQVGKKLRPMQVLVPGGAKPSGSGINPCFLWDNTAYMLGFKQIDEKQSETEKEKQRARTESTFVAFRDKHLELESFIESSAFSAVCRFLENWDPAQAHAHSVLIGVTTGFGVFQLQGMTAFVHDDPAIQSWWQRAKDDDGSKPHGQCLVTGVEASLAVTHPKIKGVRGAQSSGAAIVSFNEKAYLSYGKAQSLNAPISEETAFQYTTALNALLEGPKSSKHRISIGDATVVFWTERPCVIEDIFIPFMSSGSAELERGDVQDETLRQKLEVFVRALRLGTEAFSELDVEPNRTPFFLLGLSPNAARLSLRFFHRGTLGDLLENLYRHYNDICIDPQPASGKRKADPEFPPIWLLLLQTARETKEVPPILAGPLLRAVITGARYPDSLYSAVIRRIHADREMNYLRACILKGYLMRNKKMEVSMSLDPERPDPAYRLGRLFAALEKTQGDALPGIGATVRDRYYSSASSTPGTVFPRLLRTYQHHLAKLEGGHKVNREKLVQEILDTLNDFPAHFDLTEQGIFAIGYYHQVRAFYTKTKKKADGKDQD